MGPFLGRCDPGTTPPTRPEGPRCRQGLWGRGLGSSLGSSEPKNGPQIGPDRQNRFPAPQCRHHPSRFRRPRRRSLNLLITNSMFEIGKEWRPQLPRSAEGRAPRARMKTHKRPALFWGGSAIETHGVPKPSPNSQKTTKTTPKPSPNHSQTPRGVGWGGFGTL